MRVSFLSALHNRVDLTQAMVRSLLDTLPEGLAWELVLVDDASTDGTAAWLASLRDPRIRTLRNAENAGFAASNNRAAEAAGGAVFVLLNSDLVLLPGWLPPLLAGLERDARAGLVGNIQRRVVDGAVDHAGVVFDAIGRPMHVQRLGACGRLSAYRRREAVTAACCAVRAEVFRAAGGFDVSYRNGYEDVDLCRRLAREGLRHWVACRSTVLHHVSASPGRFDREAPNLRLFLARWGRTMSLRRRGFAYLQRYPDRPWKYNGAKLVLALAWCLTGRELPALRRRLGVDIPAPLEAPRV